MHHYVVIVQESVIIVVVQKMSVCAVIEGTICRIHGDNIYA